MDLWSVDRIEGGVAVLINESGDSSVIALADLPAEVQEGMMLRLVDGVYIVDRAVAEERKNAVLSLQEKLRRKKK